MSDVSTGFLASFSCMFMILIAGIWYPDRIPVESVKTYVKEHLPPALQKEKQEGGSSTDFSDLSSD